MKIKSSGHINSFFKNVAILVSGASLGQVIIVLSSPIITRLYSPEDFGIFALFSAVLGIIAVIGALRYELAIPLPESENKSKLIVILCFLLMFFLALIIIILEVIYGIFFDFYNLGISSFYAFLFPVAFIFLVSFSILNYWSIRNKNFSMIAIAGVIQASLITIFQILFYKNGSNSLLLGYVLSYFAASIFLLIYSFKIKNFKINLKNNNIFNIAKRYKNFPLNNTWGALAGAIGSNSPFLILGFYFDAFVAGFFLLAYRVLLAPFDVIANGISRTFFSDAAEKVRSESITGLINNVSIILVRFSIVPLIVFMFIAPEIFSVIFGEKWYSSGNFSRWLVFTVAASFIVIPISNGVLIVKEQLGIALIFQIVILIARVLSLIIFSLIFQDSLIAVIAYSISSSIVYFGLLLWILVDNKCDTKKYFQVLFKCIILGIVLGIIVNEIKMLSIGLALFAFILIIAVYFLTLYKKRVFNF